MNIRLCFGVVAFTLFSGSVAAKLPPAPPPDPVAAAAKAEKDKAAAEKGKAQQAAAEDRAVGNFHANMKKAGKPIPKPTPIIVAAAPRQVVAPAPAAVPGKAMPKTPAIPPKK
ncbi:MAG: hypothetical protein ABL931_06070 [Usitatibacteraceae bacterium]